VQNPVKVFVLYVAAVEIMRPQLKNVHRTLYDVAMRSTRTAPSDFGFRVCQYTSPSCRAARTADAFELPASRLLRLVNDKDMQVCRQARVTNEMWIITLLIAIPALLAVLGDSLADQLLGTIISTLASGIALAFSYLQVFGVGILVIPVVLIAGYFLYRYGILRMAVSYLAADGSVHKRSKFQLLKSKKNFRSEHSWAGRQLRRAWFACVEWFVYLSDPKAAVEDSLQKKSVLLNRLRTWKQMNTFSAQTAADDDTSDYFDLDRNLPVEILSMVPSSRSGFQTVTDFEGAKNLQIFESNGPGSNTKASQDLASVTASVDVALKSIVSYCVGDMGQVEDLLEDDGYLAAYFQPGASGDLVPISKLELLFAEVWNYFWPNGVMLTEAELDRVSDYFVTWTGAMLQEKDLNAGLVSTKAFISWFRKLHTFIVRIRHADQGPRFVGAHESGTDSSDDGMDGFANFQTHDSNSDDDEFFKMFAGGDLVKIDKGMSASIDLDEWYNHDDVSDQGEGSDESKDDFSWYVNSFSDADAGRSTQLVADDAGRLYQHASRDGEYEFSSSENATTYDRVGRNIRPQGLRPELRTQGKGPGGQNGLRTRYDTQGANAAGMLDSTISTSGVNMEEVQQHYRSATYYDPPERNVGRSGFRRTDSSRQNDFSFNQFSFYAGNTRSVSDDSDIDIDGIVEVSTPAKSVVSNASFYNNPQYFHRSEQGVHRIADDLPLSRLTRANTTVGSVVPDNRFSFYVAHGSERSTHNQLTFNQSATFHEGQEASASGRTQMDDGFDWYLNEIGNESSYSNIDIDDVTNSRP
jgi:hypothetical protein